MTPMRRITGGHKARPYKNYFAIMGKQ